MSRRLFHLFPLLLCVFTVTAQGSKKIQKANASFADFAFIEARKAYLKIVEEGDATIEVYRNLADSYYFNSEPNKAVDWYAKLIEEYEDDANTEDLFKYAQSLKSVAKYDESNKIMDKFYKKNSKDSRGSYFKSSKDYLDFIELQSGKFRISKLYINTPYSDHGASFDRRGNVVFASPKPLGTYKKVIHKWNEMPFLDLYVSSMMESNGILRTPKPMPANLNTLFHESTTSFSKDGSTLFLTRNNINGEEKLVRSKKRTTLLKLFRADSLKNNQWGNFREVPFNSNEYSVAHPAISTDGKRLYFSSDMPGGKGKSDLYYVDLYDDGSYGEPVNLGDTINTEGRETYAFQGDNGLIYFSSDGHVGLGGLDVFVTEELEDGSYSIPLNVGKPVNTPKDDFNFIIDDKTRIGYLSSNRIGGKGDDDIYKLTQLEDLITRCKQYVKGTVKLRHMEVSNGKSTGKMLSNDILPGATVQLINKDDKVIKTVQTDNKGNYKFQLECSSIYQIKAFIDEDECFIYTPDIKVLSTTDKFEQMHTRDLEIEKLAKLHKGDDLNKILHLNKIYFDLNKDFIRPDAAIELDKVVKVMKEYPGLKIDVRSHTDCRASDKYNMDLSDRRAHSTMNYIITQGGISSTRITGRGYGESQLINRCTDGVKCSESEHDMNRRSEFIITDLGDEGPGGNNCE